MTCPPLFDAVIECRWPKAVWLRGGRPAPGCPRPDDPLRPLRQPGTRAMRQNRWIARTLDGAGRRAELLPFLEAEAPATGNSPELVHQLLARPAGPTTPAARPWKGSPRRRPSGPGSPTSSTTSSATWRCGPRTGPPWSPMRPGRSSSTRRSSPGGGDAGRRERRPASKTRCGRPAIYFAETGKRPTGKNGRRLGRCRPSRTRRPGPGRGDLARPRPERPTGRATSSWSIWR